VKGLRYVIGADRDIAQEAAMRRGASRHHRENWV
jgi:hypothetical protein